MPSPVSPIRNRRGASLLEVIIALAIMGVVTTAVMRTYITQHKNYITQDEIASMQQSARASLDQLSKHIRMAGFQVPNTITCVEAFNSDPDTIVVTFLTSGCDSYLSSAMAGNMAKIECGKAVNCFYDNQWAYIVEPDSGQGEWFQIASVDSSNTVIFPAGALGRTYGMGSLVLGLTQCRFYIDNTTNPDNPSLKSQYYGQPPVTYAESIIDLQFQFRMPDGKWVDEPLLIHNVREISIELTARTRNPDPEKENDPYQFRTYTSSVSPRNL